MQIEKVPRHDVRVNEYSTKNHDKPGEWIGLNKENICKYTMGRDQVSGGVIVPCRHATPIANVL